MEVEDEQNNTTRETSSRVHPKNTTVRSIEPTSTQKLPISILEKNDHTSEKLVENVHPVYQNDPGNRFVDDDQF